MADVLITGASGLVGSRLVVRLRGRNDVHGTFHTHRPEFLGHRADRLHRMDVRDTAALRALAERIDPEVVVHCAANTNVDACESIPDEARRANVAPVAALARWAKGRGARLVLMSTDYVFDGTNPPYEVDAKPNPLCVYSATKAQAEACLKGLPGALIARSTVIYGADFGHMKRNFATWLIGELEQHKPVRVVDDQWNTPTMSQMIAEFVDLAIERGLEGVVHAAAADCLSRFEFARRIAARFKLDASLISPIKTDDLHQPARRPARPCLSMERSEAALGVRAWTVAESLDRFERELAAARTGSLVPWW